MKQLLKALRLVVLITLILLGYNACNQSRTKKTSMPHDLPDIMTRGKLIAVTDYNSSSYFIYRGAPMGYQYDMLELLAKHLDVDLEIIVENNLDKAFEMLQHNECDLIAMSLNVTKDRQQKVNFTKPIGQTRQVLVQRKPENWQAMAGYNLENELIRNQLDLLGKTVHVMANSAFAERLKNLSDEMGDTIHIVESEKLEVEQLIAKVAKGEIAYTVADENVALLNQTYYPNIDVATAISFPQNQAWAVNKKSLIWLDELNNWIEQTNGSALHAVIYNKYFKDMKARSRSVSPYLSLNKGQISEYDKYIKKHSKYIDWDWRLLASLIYQESRFNPQVTSWAGAFGLMQLMPTTARRFGATHSGSPEEHIKAGVKFIKWIDNQLIDSIPDVDERIKFILASYNVGLGHVLDARRLTQAHGGNPNIWDNQVDEFLRNKSNPEYYNSEWVKYGYCRGEEPYNYVKEVVRRYELYKRVIQ
ncbi:MAG: lytic transglycosylase F [Bacteroidetes bacterium HGW-Bacteroidetes-4]|jgi:membrane-bound lytic murein transglycosylase F|nr:MAG: lytic transglycosylase F [Bacteroidetes bacterium HGW-Bacteroidetes-4]